MADLEASKNVARKLGMTMERRARVSFITECEVEVYVLPSSHGAPAAGGPQAAR